MNIASTQFVLFAIAAVALYYVFPKKFRWISLLFANVAFYLFAGAEMILYVIGAAAVAYFAGTAMSKLFDEQKEKQEGLERKEKKEIKAVYTKKRKRILTLAIVVVLLGLAVVKYAGFMVENINALLGIVGVGSLGVSGKQVSEFIPTVVGCSYFTLMVISYVTDVYRGKIKAEKNFIKVFVYLSFFPHITMGPIERYDHIAPQIFEGNKFEFSNIKTGAMLVMWGFFKKLIITDRLAVITASIFGGYEDLNAIAVMFGLVLFSIQIYTDWTTYCDIVGGVAEMMGIKITQNFSQPNFSKTMPEFWRRWHMSMGAFFKDYVLYPISTSNFCLKLNKGSRKVFGKTGGKIISSALPILSVWFLTGLWHGASWNFMMWGLFQGVIIMLSVTFSPMLEKVNTKLNFKTETFSWSLFRMGRTFLLCCLGRIFFKSATLTDAFGMFSRLTVFSGGFDPFSFGLDKKDLFVAIVGVIILLAYDIFEEKGISVRKTLDKQPIIVKWLILYAVIMFIIIYGYYGADVQHTTFVYGNF